MKLAIMQPYFFPYIGYFQLINAVDKFILYDDVNFIKNGWINRNRIIINNEVKYLTIPLKNASSFKKINEIDCFIPVKELSNKIMMSYKKAPYFDNVWPLIKEILNSNLDKISPLAILSIKKISEYLDLNSTFEISSEYYAETKELQKENRLIYICKMNATKIYINPSGGVDLYKKDDFKKENIDLFFLKTNFIEYKHFSNDFISGLSILDILMFNSKDEIKSMLENYELI